MRITIPALAVALLAAVIPDAEAQYANVVINGEVKPGVYGRVEVGNVPPPVLVYPEPRVVVRDRRYKEPIYLHVPPGHAKKWDKHCHKYNACYRPVYFVKSAEYEPDYHKGKGKGHAKGHNKG